MKIKTIDLTLRQIIKICDKNIKECSKCPLFKSTFECFKLNKRYLDTHTYDRNKLMREKVEINE